MNGEKLLLMLTSSLESSKAAALEDLRKNVDDPEFRGTMEYLCKHFEKQRKRKIKAYIEKPDLFSNQSFYQAREIVERWCEENK